MNILGTSWPILSLNEIDLCTTCIMNILGASWPILSLNGVRKHAMFYGVYKKTRLLEIKLFLEFECIVLCWNHGCVNNLFYVCSTQVQQKFRYEVVDSAPKAYKARKDAGDNAERPMYRCKGWKQNERQKETANKKKSWYAKSRNESVMFVPATPR